MNLSLSPADKKLLEEVIDPNVLAEKVPYIKETLEGIEEYSNMLADISHRGKMSGIAGMNRDMNIQKVAHIPSHVATALLEVDPDILTNKRKFYAWLNGPGKAFKYSRKVVPGAM